MEFYIDEIEFISHEQKRQFQFKKKTLSYSMKLVQYMDKT